MKTWFVLTMMVGFVALTTLLPQLTANESAITVGDMAALIKGKVTQQ